ncbi:MAG: hypothetical protein ABW252_16715 [Polyangiales bacterium]
MTQQLTVQTDFRDIEQMAQGLVGRVQNNYVILPTGDAVDEGEWAQFEISLFDGSAGLAGVGRCVTLVDNGDEREPHQRYDVVLDSLQFDAHEQRVFEHILATHGVPLEEEAEVHAGEAESLPPGGHSEPPTIAADDDLVDVSDFTGPHTRHAVEAAIEESEPEADRTLTASDIDIEAALSNPEAMRPAPGGEANDAQPHLASRSAATVPGTSTYARGGGGAAHAFSPATSPVAIDEMREEPLSGERIAPTRPGPAFAYANGIPFPSKPPRPELDPSMRVTPAPRPAGSGGH